METDYKLFINLNDYTKNTMNESCSLLIIGPLSNGNQSTLFFYTLRTICHTYKVCHMVRKV